VVGIPLALGPNYNLDVDPEREKAAYDAIQNAVAVSANAPPNEHAYAAALATRFPNDPKADYHQLASAYRDAMRQLAQQYPDDPDAVTMYAESMMDLPPWQLWSLDGKPAEDTETIVAQPEAVLRAYPNHVGANHFYIHAVEASANPERALPSAQRLQPSSPTPATSSPCLRTLISALVISTRLQPPTSPPSRPTALMSSAPARRVRCTTRCITPTTFISSSWRAACKATPGVRWKPQLQWPNTSNPASST